jgi:hypothetical protein
MSGRYSLPLTAEVSGRISGLVAVAPVGISQHRDRLFRIAGGVGREPHGDPAFSGGSADLFGSVGSKGRHPRRKPRPVHEQPAAFHTEPIGLLDESLGLALKPIASSPRVVHTNTRSKLNSGTWGCMAVADNVLAI